ncbi:MAG: PQQ-binding-like beta-propeller repeat protein [Kiritimatiellaceae bacterium]|nr:PQQ-binding-like beta-propeller repeat protein [Kiritimatiellaceae bacterium]
MDEFKQSPIAGLIAQSVALVAGALVLVVSILLIADHVRMLKMDPLNDPVLLELRDQLVDSTDNNKIIEQIRTYDFYARRAFFSNREQQRSGGILLLSGAVVCFVALKFSKYWKPKLPEVEKTKPTNHWELNRLFRQLMAGAGVFLMVLSLFLAFVVQSDLETLLAQTTEPQAADIHPEQGRQDAVNTIDVPQTSSLLSALKQNWPSLRGFGNVGHAQASDAPISWDVESGEGILWKAEIPVHGFNSPIVWDKKLFFTGGDEEGLEVFCYDADTGQDLWTKTVETAAELPEVSDDTGFAAATMATDGTRVFAIFANGELVALDFEGNVVWQKNLGVPDNPYGMGSSLVSDGERLFVQYDHSDTQKVMAFNGVDGSRVWESARAHISWASPALIETKFGRQLVLNDEEFVIAYDPMSGKQLWRVECLGGEVAPSPAFNGKDIVFVANEYAQASALKLNGATPEILWQYDEYLPEISSPLATEDRFFIATSAGDLICLDAERGEVIWEQECDDGFNSSPVLAGNRVYAIDLEGVVHIFDASADTYHEIGAIDMGEPVYATPAFSNNRIYIRGDETLYCVGSE